MMKYNNIYIYTIKYPFSLFFVFILLTLFENGA